MSDLSSPTIPDTAKAANQAALWSLLFGNLVIGTGVMLPTGLLSIFMADLNIDAPTAGYLTLVGGLVVGLGAPLVAMMTSRVDRRLLLSFALLLYVIGHIGAVASQSYSMILLFRAVTIAGAAIFTPQAAATVGILVPPDRRAAGIAFIFIGWSLASVIGIPVGTLLGEALGWRPTYLLMAGLSAVGLMGIWITVPKGLRVAPLLLASWIEVLTNHRLLMVLGVTLLVMSGTTSLFTYITPILKAVYGASPTQIALIFLLSGIFGVIGNIASARYAARIGTERGVMISLALVALGLSLIAASWGNYGVLLFATCLWQVGAFTVNSFQQARLVALAPALASATIAMNTSMVYLGFAVGAKSGGVLIADGLNPGLVVAAFLFVVGAMALSFAVRAPRAD